MQRNAYCLKEMRYAIANTSYVQPTELLTKLLAIDFGYIFIKFISWS